MNWLQFGHFGPYKQSLPVAPGIFDSVPEFCADPLRVPENCPDPPLRSQNKLLLAFAVPLPVRKWESSVGHPGSRDSSARGIRNC